MTRLRPLLRSAIGWLALAAVPSAVARAQDGSPCAGDSARPKAGARATVGDTVRGARATGPAGLRLRAFARMGARRELEVWIEVRNTSRTVRNVAYGPCDVVVRLRSTSGAGRERWSSRDSTTRCPASLQLLELQPGATERIYGVRPTGRMLGAALPTGTYRVTMQVTFTRPRWAAPELTAGRLQLAP